MSTTTDRPEQCPACTTPVLRTQYYENLLMTSPILQPARLSNSFPCDSAYSYVHTDVLPQIHKDILALRDQLECMEQITARMQRDQSSLLAIAARYKALISPIRLLPPEILSTIFHYACFSFDGKHNEPSSRTLDVEGAHWAISRVSRYWRETIISCSSIWAKLQLELPFFATIIKPPDVARRALDLALERSLQHPVDSVFQLNGRVPEEGQSPEAHELESYIVSRLCAESARWRRVMIILGMVGEAEIRALFTATASAGFPQLVELRFENACNTIALVDFSESPPVPNLRHVTLIDTLVRDMPCAQLTTLNVTVFNVLSEQNLQDYLDMLSHCQQLSSLFLHTRCTSKNLDSDILFPVRPRIIELPRLRQLSVDEMLFLQHLSFPCLEDLHISSFPEPLRILPSCLYRLHCPNITLLRLEHITPSVVAYFAAWESSKNITNLVLCLRPSSPMIPVTLHDKYSAAEGVTGIFHTLYPTAITHPDEHNDFFPNITTLSLHFDNDASYLLYFDDVFVRMLQARWNGCMSARLMDFEFVLHSIPPWPSDTLHYDAETDELIIANGGLINLKAIRMLVNEGMCVRIQLLDSVERKDHVRGFAIGHEPDLPEKYWYWR